MELCNRQGLSSPQAGESFQDFSSHALSWLDRSRFAFIIMSFCYAELEMLQYNNENGVKSHLALGLWLD